jgi:hypothetical protein
MIGMPVIDCHVWGHAYRHDNFELDVWRWNVPTIILECIILLDFINLKSITWNEYFQFKNEMG